MTRPFVVLMLSTTFLTGMASLAAGQDAGPSARDKIELNRSVIEGKRKEIQQKALELTPQQSEEFWPVYNDYAGELSKLGDQKTRLLQSYAMDYANMSEKQSDDLLSQWFKLRSQQLEIQRRYVGKFRKVLPGPKVVRVFQMETLMDAIVTGNIQAALPLAGSDSTAKPQD